jgi:hypothetical protein
MPPLNVLNMYDSGDDSAAPLSPSMPSKSEPVRSSTTTTCTFVSSCSSVYSSTESVDHSDSEADDTDSLALLDQLIQETSLRWSQSAQTVSDSMTLLAWVTTVNDYVTDGQEDKGQLIQEQQAKNEPTTTTTTITTANLPPLYQRQYEQQHQQFWGYPSSKPLHAQDGDGDGDDIDDIDDDDEEEEEDNDPFNEEIDCIPVEHIEVVQCNNYRRNNFSRNGSNHNHNGNNNNLDRDDSGHGSVTSGLTSAHFSTRDLNGFQTDESISDWHTEGDPVIITPVAGAAAGANTHHHNRPDAESISDAVIPVANRADVAITHHNNRPDAESISDAVIPVANRRRVREYPLVLIVADGSARHALYSGPLKADSEHSHSTTSASVTGIGVLKFPATGDMYMGEVVSGEMHGFGTYTFTCIDRPTSSYSSSKPKRKRRAHKMLKGFFHHNVYTGEENKNAAQDEDSYGEAPVPPL